MEPGSVSSNIRVMRSRTEVGKSPPCFGRVVFGGSIVKRGQCAYTEVRSSESVDEMANKARLVGRLRGTDCNVWPASNVSRRWSSRSMRPMAAVETGVLWRRVDGVVDSTAPTSISPWWCTDASSGSVECPDPDVAARPGSTDMSTSRGVHQEIPCPSKS